MFKSKANYINKMAKKRRKKRLIYENFKLSLAYLKNLKNFFWFSLVLFLIISVFGYVFPVFFEEQVLKIIEELLRETEGMGGFELTRFIIFNNIKSAFFAMIFGIALGIVPIAVAVVNAYVLGFVSAKSVEFGGFLVLLRLVPHGIFEIPAIIISIALGLKLGMFLFIYKGKNKKTEFWKWFKDSLRVFVFIIIPLLVIAGIIEGLLIWLLSG